MINAFRLESDISYISWLFCGFKIIKSQLPSFIAFYTLFSIFAGLQN
jgi:hypothetical protein